MPHSWTSAESGHSNLCHTAFHHLPVRRVHPEDIFQYVSLTIRWTSSGRAKWDTPVDKHTNTHMDRQRDRYVVRLTEFEVCVDGYWEAATIPSKLMRTLALRTWTSMTNSFGKNDAKGSQRRYDRPDSDCFSNEKGGPLHSANCVRNSCWTGINGHLHTTGVLKSRVPKQMAIRITQ